jgi:hypothetical protein
VRSSIMPDQVCNGWCCRGSVVTDFVVTDDMSVDMIRYRDSAVTDDMSVVTDGVVTDGVVVAVCCNR